MKQKFKLIFNRVFYSKLFQLTLQKVKFIILRFPIVKSIILKLLHFSPKFRCYLEQVWISSEKHKSKTSQRTNYIHQVSSAGILLPKAKEINAQVKTDQSIDK